MRFFIVLYVINAIGSWMKMREKEAHLKQIRRTRCGLLHISNL